MGASCLRRNSGPCRGVLTQSHGSLMSEGLASHALGRQRRRCRCHYGPLKAADSKHEQLRRYLEKSGVLDTLTKVLVALYEEPEKPNSALDFLKHHLGAATPENPEIELLRLELAEMKEKYEAMVEENKKLKIKSISLGSVSEFSVLMS
ncbi:c-Myc-binding protein-like [Tupaia chinensis]|uniref:c-Myc-binding protein-like n=1 Tax=Tupaia chinensis TaxID=246437 RepID=UPI000FFBAFB9|nr:c-Myc-binding protein-like [Tupaia chinensis]